MKQLHSTTSEAVIKATKEIFSLFGSPKEIMCDNKPQFFNQYNLFCEKWGIKHTSSPQHPQFNGFIERQIRHIKPIVKVWPQKPVWRRKLWQHLQLHSMEDQLTIK